VKDVLREYGRTVALFSAAGLVLSLLVGLLARNPFGVMLLRALLFAVLFGGVGAGLRYIVRRFLPELVAGEAAGAAAADDASVRPEGSTIDIVLPEEPPPVEGARQGQGEILEELPGTGDAGSVIAVEEIDTAEPAAAPEPTPRHRSAEPPAFHEGLDALPDIAPLGEGGVTARRAGSRAKPSDAAHSVLEREDPASLARAVRTVLKREERS
jgi:hypothetical protein